MIGMTLRQRARKLFRELFIFYQYYLCNKLENFYEGVFHYHTQSWRQRLPNHPPCYLYELLHHGDIGLSMRYD